MVFHYVRIMHCLISCLDSNKSAMIAKLSWGPARLHQHAKKTSGMSMALLYTQLEGFLACWCSLSGLKLITCANHDRGILSCVNADSV